MLDGWDPSLYSGQKGWQDVLTCALVYAIDIHMGVGVGAKCSFEIDDIGFNLGYSHNVGELYFEKCHFGTGAADRKSYSANFGLFSIGKEEIKRYDFDNNLVSSETPLDIFEYHLPDLEISFELYVGYGFNFYVGINWDRFFEYLDEHAERIDYFEK